MLLKFTLDRMRRYVDSPEKLHKQIAAQNQSRLFLKALWVAFIIALVIFGLKIADTSSWAMEYDRNVQEQIGYWVIGLMAGAFIVGLVSVSRNAERKAVGILKAEWFERLKNDLAEASSAFNAASSDADRQRLAEQKRELEGHLQRLQVP